jgi:AbrB family looped-hinge helix DNA binding protein
VLIAVITSNGRITLPSILRERFNLRKGDKLDFQIEENGTVRVRFLTKRAAEVAGHFRHKATKARSVAEINSVLRAAFRAGRV